MSRALVTRTIEVTIDDEQFAAMSEGQFDVLADNVEAYLDAQLETLIKSLEEIYRVEVAA